MKKIFFFLFFSAALFSIFIFTLQTNEALSVHTTTHTSPQTQGSPPQASAQQEVWTVENLNADAEQWCASLPTPAFKNSDFLEFIQKVRLNPSVEEETLWKNFHLVSPQGKKLILRIQNEVSVNSESSRKIFQLYEEDETGFPWPKTMTDEEKKWSEESLAQILHSNSLQKTQEVIQLSTPEFELIYQNENQKITRFQWVTSTGYTECQLKNSSMQCHCKQ